MHKIFRNSLSACHSLLPPSFVGLSLSGISGGRPEATWLRSVDQSGNNLMDQTYDDVMRVTTDPSTRRRRQAGDLPPAWTRSPSPVQSTYLMIRKRNWPGQSPGLKKPVNLGLLSPDGIEPREKPEQCSSVARSFERNEP